MATESEFAAEAAERQNLFNKAVEILKQNLTRQEFLNFQIHLDCGFDEDFYDVVTEQAAIMDPDSFYQDEEKP